MMMMRFRQSLREDFPKGWWRSATWWKAGISLRGVVTVLAPVFTLRRVRDIVRLRRDPVRLAARQDTEAYGIGLVTSLALMLLTAQVVMVGGPLWVVALLSVIALMNGATCAMVVVTIARSRLDDRYTWGAIDYVDRHAPQVIGLRTRSRSTRQ